MTKSLIPILVLILFSGCAANGKRDLLKYQSRCSHLTVEQQNKNLIIPYFRPRPRVPIEAQLKKIDGYVDLEFDLSTDGNPIKISKLEASPSEIFINAAIINLKGYKFKPKMVNGKPVISRCHIMRIAFRNS